MLLLQVKKIQRHTKCAALQVISKIHFLNKKTIQGHKNQAYIFVKSIKWDLNMPKVLIVEENRRLSFTPLLFLNYLPKYLE
jgi:hypothetical protein